MEMKQIEAFLMVAEKGSFSAAAEALFITQPAISARIRHLEQELNTTLFQRINGKKVILTPEGEKILPYFKEAFQLIRQGCSTIHRVTGHYQKITISFPNFMGVEVLPELLKVLYHDFPTIDFPVKIREMNEIIEDLRAGKAEVGFTYVGSEESFPDLEMIQIAREKNILVCAPDHPLTQWNGISAENLKDERILIYNRTSVTAKMIEDYLQKQGLQEYKSTEINNLGWIKMMIRKRLGVAFLPKMVVNDELLSGKLLELPINEPPPSIPIFFVYKKTLAEDVKHTIIRTAKGLFQQF
ncbi:LysR family transcriptional regulator [Bacillaceae bacterium]